MSGIPDALPRVPTAELYNAILNRTPLFQAIVSALAEKCDLPQQQVTQGLNQLLGPISFKEMFDVDRHYSIPNMPFRIELDGKHVQLLESNPLLLLECSIAFKASTLAMIKEFGGLEGFMRKRQKFVQEGGNVSDLDSYVINYVLDGYRKTIESARRKLNDGSNEI